MISWLFNEVYEIETIALCGIDFLKGQFMSIYRKDIQNMFYWKGSVNFKNIL